MLRLYAGTGGPDTLHAGNSLGVAVQSTIVVPSYIRPALPADLPNVLVLDEEQRLTPEQAATVGFYVRPYYQAMGAEEFAGMGAQSSPEASSTNSGTAAIRVVTGTRPELIASSRETPCESMRVGQRKTP